MWITLTLLACVGRPAEPAPSQEPAPAETPRLVVLLVADQLPVELFGRVQPHFKHGLATLTDEAAWVGRAIFAHSVTLTCPGHATLASGASPRVHGIVSNNWITQGEAKYCGDIANLRADTIGDRVHEAGGKVASLSIKDRAAIMMGGRNPDAAVWYLRNEGTWNEQAPEWALQSQIDDVLNSTWEPLDPSLYAQHFPDRQELSLIHI